MRKELWDEYPDQFDDKYWEGEADNQERTVFYLSQYLRDMRAWQEKWKQPIDNWHHKAQALVGMPGAYRRLDTIMEHLNDVPSELLSNPWYDWVIGLRRLLEDYESIYQENLRLSTQTARENDG